MKRFSKQALMLGAALACVTVIGSVAKAEEIETITVTAEKRAQNIQQVPISITAYDAKDIEENFASAFDIAKFAPNVQIDTFLGYGVPKLSIRGISQSDFNPQASTPIIMYADEVVLNNLMLQGVPAYDMERIEILRGPQGTLYGRNATAGAIRLISAKPSSDFLIEGHASYGNYNQRKFEGVINGPITDWLNGRLAFTTSSREGEYENDFLHNKYGAKDMWSARGQLDFVPSADFNLLLEAQFFHGRDEPYGWMSFRQAGANDFGDWQRSVGFVNVTPGTNYTHMLSEDNGFEKVQTQMYSAVAKYDMGGVQLTAIGGYVKGHQEWLLDNDSTQYPIINEYKYNNAESWNTELRLTSTAPGPFQWIAGVFDMTEHSSVKTRLDESTLLIDIFPYFPTYDGIGKARYTSQTLTTYAGYIHTTYNWTDNFQTTQAIRWTHERKDFLNVLGQLGSFTPMPDFITAVRNDAFTWFDPFVYIPNSRSWDKFTWRLAANYQIDPDKMIYASVSTGFKSGSFQPGADDAVEVRIVNPETVTAYEAGIKSDWDDHSLRVNGSIFYNDYHGFQTSQLLSVGTDLLQLLSNLKHAETYGGELEIVAAPTDHLLIQTGFGVTQSRILAAADPTLIGNKLPLVETFNNDTRISYEFETEGGTVTPEFSWTYHGPYYQAKENLNKLGNYWIFNARLDYESKDHSWYAALWANNLFDKVVPVLRDLDLQGAGLGTDLAWINDHRMIGVTVGFRQ